MEKLKPAGLKPVFFSLLGATFITASSAIAAPTTLLVEGAWPALSITACQAERCTTLTPPGDMLEAMRDGYDQVSVDDLTLDGTPEIILTHRAEGSVNACTRVYRYDNALGTLHPLGDSSRQLCNYVIAHGHVISRYRSGAMWHEDIYQIKNNDLILAYSDSCVGCDTIKRTRYQDDARTDTLLVTNNLDHRLRKPVSTTVLSKKAVLYREPRIDQPTRMYLISGDEVVLTDATSDDDTYWYRIRYTTAKGKPIEGWLRCDDTTLCDDERPQ
ncbi:hypothetical protein [Pseudomonas sp. GD03944]|uniref:hypothetical protein n=1 Tax=Pseudomonas sp. GD03944 TaxID=2975409 RepID=UPI00244A1A91|nr:hypothetical protein [Pseudomonas sp. GD03944]MDH1263842.1 hypothetical protein [Pseudomonas sp. GD03944]